MALPLSRKLLPRIAASESVVSPSALGGGPLQQRLHMLLPADARPGGVNKTKLEI